MDHRPHRVLMCAAVALGCVGLTSCGSGSDDENTTQNKPATVTVTQSAQPAEAAQPDTSGGGSKESDFNTEFVTYTGRYPEPKLYPGTAGLCPHLRDGGRILAWLSTKVDDPPAAGPGDWGKAAFLRIKADCPEYTASVVADSDALNSAAS